MSKFFLFLVLIGGLAYFGYRRFIQPKQFGDLKPVKIIDADTGEQKAVFDVEVADTVTEKAKGLMFREELPLSQGMLFTFNQEAKHWMWMKNTKIPLDIIFINSNEQVVEIIENAQPGNEESLSGGEMSLYALEINGGLVEKYGIKKGDKVTILDFRI